MQALKSPLFELFGLNVFMLRLDLNHKHISGNKWYKLKYNLEEAKRQNKHTVLTFGGAFSNHIAATAAAGKEFGLNTIGVIRGDELDQLNPTLHFAKEAGMQLHFISREEYKNRNTDDFIRAISKRLNDPYIIPEGGSNDLGIKGCTEILNSVKMPFDHIVCACGTGTTLAGIALSLNAESQALGIQVLKAEGYIFSEVQKMIGNKATERVSVNEAYHFGGYAKTNAELKTFVAEFEQEHGFRLDPIYTGKMMFGIMDLVKRGYFKKGQTIIAVHTGGLQGNAGFYGPVS